MFLLLRADSSDGTAAAVRIAGGTGSNASAARGHNGQVSGALNPGPAPEPRGAMRIAMAMFMAQWWAPFRRQQAGRSASWLAGSAAASGPKRKNRTRKVVSPFRI